MFFQINLKDLERHGEKEPRAINTEFSSNKSVIFLLNAVQVLLNDKLLKCTVLKQKATGESENFSYFAKRIENNYNWTALDASQPLQWVSVGLLRQKLGYWKIEVHIFCDKKTQIFETFLWTACFYQKLAKYLHQKGVQKQETRSKDGNFFSAIKYGFTRLWLFQVVLIWN